MSLPREDTGAPPEVGTEHASEERPESPPALAAEVEALSHRVAELRELLVKAHEELLLRDEEIASLHELAAKRDDIRRLQSTMAWRLSTRYWRARDRLVAFFRSRTRR